MPAPKGASDFEECTVSLKRYPDTKPGTILLTLGARFRCDRDLIDDFNAVAFETQYAAGMVGEQSDSP